MSKRKARINFDDTDMEITEQTLPYQVKPNELLNVYKEPINSSPIIGIITRNEIGTVNKIENNLGYITEKKGWINTSKTENI